MPERASRRPAGRRAGHTCWSNCWRTGAILAYHRRSTERRRQSAAQKDICDLQRAKRRRVASQMESQLTRCQLQAVTVTPVLRLSWSGTVQSHGYCVLQGPVSTLASRTEPQVSGPWQRVSVTDGGRVSRGQPSTSPSALVCYSAFIPLGPGRLSLPNHT